MPQISNVRVLHTSLDVDEFSSGEKYRSVSDHFAGGVCGHAQVSAHDYLKVGELCHL